MAPSAFSSQWGCWAENDRWLFLSLFLIGLKRPVKFSLKSACELCAWEMNGCVCVCVWLVWNLWPQMPRALAAHNYVLFQGVGIYSIPLLRMVALVRPHKILWSCCKTGSTVMDVTQCRSTSSPKLSQSWDGKKGNVALALFSKTFSVLVVLIFNILQLYLSIHVLQIGTPNGMFPGILLDLSHIIWQRPNRTSFEWGGKALKVIGTLCQIQVDQAGLLLFQFSRLLKFEASHQCEGQH